MIYLKEVSFNSEFKKNYKILKIYRIYIDLIYKMSQKQMFRAYRIYYILLYII